MLSKLELRKKIEGIKDKYSKDKDKSLLLEAAILKGLYLALDGAKGIPLPNKYNHITSFSKIIFKYKIKSENMDRAYNYLYTSLMLNNKMPEYYIHKIPKSNADIAEILADILMDVYTDDINVNYELVYNIALNNLNEFGVMRDGSILQCGSNI